MKFTQLQTEYRQRLSSLNKVKDLVTIRLTEIFDTPVHTIKSRIKEADSLFQKISRKGYDKPFEQCTDLLGFRVICLFKGQVDQIVKSIEKEFEVVEKSRNDKDVDRFSYGSYHILCRLKNVSSELSFTFEIQVRTTLQEAWAEVEHYLNYKHIGIDREQLRKINALSALFEIADDQFQQIHDCYDEANKNPTNISKLTPESIYHYCKKTFPWAWQQKEHFKTEQIEEYSKLLSLCEKRGIQSIKELDELYEKNKQDLSAYDKKHVEDIVNSSAQWPVLAQKVKEANHFFSPMLLLSIMLRELDKKK